MILTRVKQTPAPGDENPWGPKDSVLAASDGEQCSVGVPPTFETRKPRQHSSAHQSPLACVDHDWSHGFDHPRKQRETHQDVAALI